MIFPEIKKFSLYDYNEIVTASNETVLSKYIENKKQKDEKTN